VGNSLAGVLNDLRKVLLLPAFDLVGDLVCWHAASGGISVLLLGFDGGCCVSCGARGVLGVCGVLGVPGATLGPSSSRSVWQRAVAHLPYERSDFMEGVLAQLEGHTALHGTLGVVGVRAGPTGGFRIACEYGAGAAAVPPGRTAAKAVREKYCVPCSAGLDDARAESARGLPGKALPRA